MTTLEERVSRLEGGYEHLATKADIADTKADIANLRAYVADVRADMKAEMGDLRGAIGDLRGAIGDLKAEIIKWMVGMMVGTIAAASSIALLVQRLTS